MTSLFRKRAKKAGLPPGTLVYVGEQPIEKVRLSIIEYNETTIQEKNDVTIQECLDHIETPDMTWVQVYGVYDPATIAAVGSHFKLHALALEDILNTGQRSKLDEYQNQLFIVVRLLLYDNEKQILKDEQVSLIIGPNYLISFLESYDGLFQPIKERLQQANNRIRKLGSDYLAYAILDNIVDHYFAVLEQVDISLEKLEDELGHAPKPTTIQKIQGAKHDMIFLRKSVWPIRDVINRFQRLESPLVSATTQFYLRDVYDHVIQIIDIIEGFRDVVAGMLDIYLSNINIRTNEIMKVLTIVSTIFVPLTFITSMYGMNFEFMPELRHPWGYPAVLFIMTSVAIGMLIYFRRKNWI